MIVQLTITAVLATVAALTSGGSGGDVLAVDQPAVQRAGSSVAGQECGLVKWNFPKRKPWVMALRFDRHGGKVHVRAIHLHEPGRIVKVKKHIGRNGHARIRWPMRCDNNWRVCLVKTSRWGRTTCVFPPDFCKVPQRSP